MAQLESEYSAEATQGPLICDITYPMDAPGFVYDPTGSIQKDAFKNGKQVLLPRCSLACETIPCVSSSDVVGDVLLSGKPLSAVRHVLCTHSGPVIPFHRSKSAW